VELTIHPI